jgi:hypothetical protein
MRCACPQGYAHAGDRLSEEFSSGTRARAPRNGTVAKSTRSGRLPAGHDPTRHVGIPPIQKSDVQCQVAPKLGLSVPRLHAGAALHVEAIISMKIFYG